MLVVVFVVLLLLCLCKNSFIRPPSFPPGPPCLPFLGNILSVWWGLRQVTNNHTLWQKWSKTYGNVVGLRLAGISVVIVSGKHLIREVSSRDVFDGRPDGFFYMLRSLGKKLGLVFTEGAQWSANRRVVLRYLKSFGYGTRSMEKYILEECKALVQLRVEDSGKPVQMSNMFDVSIVNILWRLVAGKRHELSDHRLKTLCRLVTRAFRVVDMSGGALAYMPSLRHLIPDRIGYTELVDIHRILYGFIEETIQEHKSTIDVKNPRDAIDALLIDMMEKKSDAFSLEQLQVVCLDLLEAGLETVSNTLNFLLLYLVINQNVQKKVQREIDEVVGVNTPTLNDRSQMIYTEATILEGLRMSTVPAIGIPHKAMEDAKLDNYVIPKGSVIFLALYDLHNGDHWQDPKAFRPERFLTKQGNLMQDEWLLPFGTGHRRCIGEGLARSELFLFLTHILQKFNLESPAGDPAPSIEPVDGVSLSPQPFRVLFKLRK